MKPNQSNNSSKKIQIEKMFDSISVEYDLLNRILTFGSDIRWRKKIVSIARTSNPKHILDIATGTADIALELSKFNDSKITGVDISRKMLEVSDRYIIPHYHSLAEIGNYSMGAKVANILEVALLVPFLYAWQPFYYSPIVPQ
jgi:predicted TPR repeat methyltransferase